MRGFPFCLSLKANLLELLSLLFLWTAACCSVCEAQSVPAPKGVCPPFYLLNEKGKIINPLTGERAEEPYSPKQTCGQCHDYDLITKGYHFTQGAGEEPTPDQANRCQWASSPGNYGGTWCSPSPLYRYLSPKQNDAPSAMDLTSFTFLTEGCGACHPGGGSAEYDRDGKRYDHWMSDPSSGFTPGGDNSYDGDYYRAKWSESGVLEADCLLCHLPAYDFDARNRNIGNLNLRWAASAGSGLASVAGAVAEGTPVSIAYDPSKFNEDGTVSPHIVREPRDETCLACHAKPGWKKRGANFLPRTDVHSRAGLKCVDCHATSSRAADARIRGKEVHQIGKGDDPGGRVRDDLDNTMWDCAGCHDQGYLGAPVAEHRGLPPLHLQRISCQACHIPERAVKAAQIVASDVFNPGAKIPTKGKHLWTFYGPDGTYWNHYGDLEMMGYDDKPTDPYRPSLVRYKGKIYPVNRIHNSWPAIEIDGREGLMQPRMGDVYRMWDAHHKDPEVYPSLSIITDDSGDGVAEINRPEEIEALITAHTEMLAATGYPMEGKRVVWVANNRVYRSGTEFGTIPMEDWEASPYANVHKYNHDVYPARAALGSKGCADCHGAESGFFKGAVLVELFDPQTGQLTWAPNHEILRISSSGFSLGVFREMFLKPAAPWLLGVTILLLLLHFAIFGHRVPFKVEDDRGTVLRFSLTERISHFLVFAGFLVLAGTGFLFFNPGLAIDGEGIRNLHAWAGIIFGLGWAAILVLWSGKMLFSHSDKNWLRALGGYFGGDQENLPAAKFNAGQKLFFWLIASCGAALVLTGIAMYVLRDNPTLNLSILYTVHDLSGLTLLLLVITHIYLGVVLNTHSLRSIFGGSVSRQWMGKFHPEDQSPPILSQSKNPNLKV